MSQAVGLGVTTVAGAARRVVRRRCSQLEEAWAASRDALSTDVDVVDLSPGDRMIAGLLPLGVEDGAAPPAVPPPWLPSMSASPFGDLLQPRRRPGYEVTPVAATWDFTVFRLAGPVREAFARACRARSLALSWIGSTADSSTNFSRPSSTPIRPPACSSPTSRRPSQGSGTGWSSAPTCCPTNPPRWTQLCPRRPSGCGPRRPTSAEERRRSSCPRPRSHFGPCPSRHPAGSRWPRRLRRVLPNGRRLRRFRACDQRAGVARSGLPSSPCFFCSWREAPPPCPASSRAGSRRKSPSSPAHPPPSSAPSPQPQARRSRRLRSHRCPRSAGTDRGPGDLHGADHHDRGPGPRPSWTVPAPAPTPTPTIAPMETTVHVETTITTGTTNTSLTTTTTVPADFLRCDRHVRLPRRPRKR